MCEETVDWNDLAEDTIQCQTLNTIIDFGIQRRGFEPAISASERPQTHALDRAATRIGG
jgi:hypothetical protein